MVPGLLVLVAAAPAGRAQGLPDYERPPISYSETAPAGAVADLQRRLRDGGVTLAGSDREVLVMLLTELKVPVASQVVVFSKTSLQRGRIRPQNPRAIYFSDTVYVGWVPGGLIEITVVEPELGPVFYSFDPAALRGGPPRIVRDSGCLSCHAGSFVREVPGLLVRSVYPAATGEPLLRFGTVLVDDQTPFADRWGGWYVTGYRGAAPHRGNTVAREAADRLIFEPVSERPGELSAYFPTDNYPAATSDVVALLVLEHQAAMQNVLTRASFSARRMIVYQRSLQRQLQEPETDEPTYDSVRSVFAGAAQDIVDRLLFRREAALPEGVVGGEAFREAFAAGARRARDGRSLRDFDLNGRIFALRCSYLIHSEMFAALPEALRARIFDRLRAALESRDPNDRHAYLPAGEKRAIFDLLIDTLPEAKRRWAP
jgi:hypothetical protein